MMDAEDIDAAPVLSSGSVLATRPVQASNSRPSKAGLRGVRA